MQLYSGTSLEFVDASQRNQLANRISDRFNAYFGYEPSSALIRSWQNSLSRMADLMQIGNLVDQGVIVEYQLPLTSRRLDVMLTGHGNGGKPNAVIVELKQWEKVDPSPIDECVATFIGGRVRDHLHPSIQADGYREYLVDTHVAFGDGSVALRACSYLHNLRYENAAVIFAESFAQVLMRIPSFTLEDPASDDGIVEFLAAAVGEGAGSEVLRTVTEGGYRPQRRLLEHTARIIRNEPTFTLLDEQRVAFNDALGKVRAAQLTNDETVMVIKGGPGTGKSLIALNLVAELSADNYATMHATGSKAFTENLRKVVGRRAAAQFGYFNSFVAAEPRSFDLLVCDEAHRIRESSNNRFSRRSEKDQIEELLDVAKVSVFFIDDMQVVRPGEVGSSELIRQAAKRRGIDVVEHELEAQFRCNGSDAYIQWVDNTLQLRRTPHVLWERADPFTFDVVDSAEELEAIIWSKADDGNSARLVAGYCWRWSEPDDEGHLFSDVKVGSWSRPWNAKPDAGRLAPGIPKSHYWASDPKGLNQVGCIYTAQGFEFDYVGVIWGPDLVYRPGVGWQGQPEHSYDPPVKRSAARDPQAFLRLVKHTYRVLLTRGLQGCFVYFTDRATRDFVLSRTELIEQDI